MTPLPKTLETTLEFIRSAREADLLADFLIETADRFRPVPEDVARRPFAPADRVPGCESEVFLWATSQDGRRANLHFAVENPQGISAKALAVILQDAFKDASPDELRGITREVAYEIFGRNLSMGKGQGLMNMVEMARTRALQALKPESGRTA